MTTVHRPTSTSSGSGSALVVPLAVAGALLSLAVGVIHVVDQGGVGALKDPAYVGYGYWILEAVSVLTAIMVFLPSLRTRLAGWFLALGVGAGPIIGYVLSRGPGLPSYTDDQGEWTEPLGLLSLVVEGVLVLVALGVLARRRA